MAWWQKMLLPTPWHQQWWYRPNSTAVLWSQHFLSRKQYPTVARTVPVTHTFHTNMYISSERSTHVIDSSSQLLHRDLVNWYLRRIRDKTILNEALLSLKLFYLRRGFFVSFTDEAHYILKTLLVKISKYRAVARAVMATPQSLCPAQNKVCLWPILQSSHYTSISNAFVQVSIHNICVSLILGRVYLYTHKPWINPMDK